MEEMKDNTMKDNTMNQNQTPVPLHDIPPTIVTRAKFRCEAIEKTRYAQGPHVQTMTTVKLLPVYGTKVGTENEAFFQSTPSGRIELGCLNAAAADNFELGQEYYVDFINAASVAPKS